MKKDSHLEASVRQIELFDTAIAFLAGLLIVPSVFVFSGGDEAALGKGPSLMFITLPKVFNDMTLGGVIGAVFFLLVLFAASHPLSPLWRQMFPFSGINSGGAAKNQH